MGSGASKVEALNIDVEDQSTKVKTKRESIRNEKVQESASNNVESNQELHKKSGIENKNGCDQILNKDVLLHEALEKIGMLEKQVIEFESRELDLHDQIQALEERIVNLATENNIKEQSETLTETLNLKDQCIAKLEKEAEDSKTLIKQLKIRHKKKVKLLNSKIAEAKQDSSLQTLELKEDILKLKDENVKMKEKYRESERDSAIMDEEEDFGSNKTKLILELSSQVSEQEELILTLQKQLSEKDKKLEHLQNETKQNCVDDFRDDSSFKTLESDEKSTSQLGTQVLVTRKKKRNKFKNMNRVKGASGSCDSGIYPNFIDCNEDKIFQRLDQHTLTNGKEFLSESDEDQLKPSLSTKVHSAPAGTRSNKPGSKVSRSDVVRDIDLEDSWAWDDDKIIQSSWKKQ